MKKLRVLVRFSALGDLVLCTALVRRLQRMYPDDELVFVTSAEYAIFVESSFPRPIEVVAARAENLLGWMSEGARVARQLDEREVTEIFDLHGVSKSKAFLWGLRAVLATRGQYPRFKKSPKHGFLRMLSVMEGRDLLGPRHVYREHWGLADSSETRAKSDEPILVADRAQSRDRLLLAPDAKHWKKRWPEKNWIRLVELAFNERPNLEISLVGGEACLSPELRALLRERYAGRVKDLLGQTPISELARIAASHELTVCGNSAWLHISEAVGTPVVSLAGPIVPGFGFSPWRSQSAELSVKLPCRPCTRHGGGKCIQTGENYHLCMTALSPELVWSECQSRLGAIAVGATPK